MFLNIRIDLLILKTYYGQFTLTIKNHCISSLKLFILLYCVMHHWSTRGWEQYKQLETNMSVLSIVGPKCTLAASVVSHGKHVDGTDTRTDARRLHFTLSALEAVSLITVVIFVTVKWNNTAVCWWPSADGCAGNTRKPDCMLKCHRAAARRTIHARTRSRPLREKTPPALRRPSRLLLELAKPVLSSIPTAASTDALNLHVYVHASTGCQK